MSVILFTPTLLPISNKFKSLLNQTLCDYLSQATQLNQQSSGEWNIEYITEFAYFGNYYPELEKSIDFDITNNCWFTSHSGWLSFKTHQQDVNELYQVWEGNFLAYVDMDAYDQIKVNC
ncbi:TPA: DUF2787 family protein [Photobacterium damselae]